MSRPCEPARRCWRGATAALLLALPWGPPGCAPANDGKAESPGASADQEREVAGDAARPRDARAPSAESAASNGPAPTKDDLGTSTDPSSATAPDGATPTGGPTANDAGVDLSVELYDPGAFPRFDLELPEASVSALGMVANSEDPRQNTYVTATLKYGNETVSNIGLRLKGEGSFQKLDQKPAFKLKFDEFVDKQSFRGLRRMTLNNAFEDPSFVAERLAYEVFRALGLPAPRCNNATLYVNGAFYGVYVNVEAEDKTFLRRWFEDDGGNLYEEGQKDFVPGAETAFNLETNETKNDRTDLRNLIAALQAAKSETFLEDIGSHLDTRQFLKFTAAEAAVNQWDMYAYTVFFVNNLRIYHDPKSQKFSFVPWGMDMSMKPFRDSGKPNIRLFALARQGDRPNGPVTAGLLFQRCLLSPACKTAYIQAVEEVIGAYEQLDLPARAMTYYAQIRGQVMADTKKRVCCSGGMLSDQQFETAFLSVLATLRGRVAALRADLAAK